MRFTNRPGDAAGQMREWKYGEKDAPGAHFLIDKDEDNLSDGRRRSYDISRQVRPVFEEVRCATGGDVHGLG